MTRRRPLPPAPPLPAPSDDERDPKELSPAENADLCTGCVRCCTYLSIEIDAPRAAWEYDQWIWAIHHRGVELYLEQPEKWFLYVEARCAHLAGDGRCGVYGRRPVLCREYDPRSCERRYPLSDIRAWFKTGEELEAWLARERPSHHRRLLAYRKDQPSASARPARAPSPLLVAIEGLDPPAPARAARGVAAAAPRATRRTLR